jgi:hypothetical protein
MESLARSTKLYLNNAREYEQNETVCINDAVAQGRLDTHKREFIKLNQLHNFCQVSFVNKLHNACRTLADQQRLKCSKLLKKLGSSFLLTMGEV